MMRNFDNAMVWSFFKDRLGLHHSADFRGVMHIPSEYANEVPNMDQVAVAVGYNAFIGRTCCMHCVVQRPELLTRAMVREAFEFPFVIAECNAILALVESTNAAALKFDKKLGFREVYRIPQGGMDGDLCVLQMLRTECRWLRPH